MRNKTTISINAKTIKTIEQKIAHATQLQNANNISGATELYLEAINLYNQINKTGFYNKNIADICYSIGSMNAYSSPEMAIRYYNSSIDIYDNLNKSHDYNHHMRYFSTLATLHEIIAGIYLNNQNIDNIYKIVDHYVESHKNYSKLINRSNIPKIQSKLNGLHNSLFSIYDQQNKAAMTALDPTNSWKYYNNAASALTYLNIMVTPGHYNMKIYDAKIALANIAESNNDYLTTIIQLNSCGSILLEEQKKGQNHNDVELNCKLMNVYASLYKLWDKLSTQQETVLPNSQEYQQNANSSWHAGLGIWNKLASNFHNILAQVQSEATHGRLVNSDELKKMTYIIQNTDRTYSDINNMFSEAIRILGSAHGTPALKRKEEQSTQRKDPQETSLTVKDLLGPNSWTQHAMGKTPEDIKGKEDVPMAGEGNHHGTSNPREVIYID